MICLVAVRGKIVWKVINGQLADSTNYPVITWQVALSISSGGGSSLCGGSLISDRHVLTAAHCIKDLSSGALTSPDSILVIPGISRSGSSFRTVRYNVHPSYDRSFSSQQRIDLAVLELTAAIPVTSGIAPISLCSGVTACHTAGAPLFVSGYGQRVSSSSASVSTSLIYADLFAIDQGVCAAKWNSNFNCQSCLPTTNVCAGSNPVDATPAKDSCFGDSGGPLVRNFGTTVSPDFRLVGVVSSGTVPVGSSLSSCGEPGEYGVYVSVPGNLDWIQSVERGDENATAVTSNCVSAGTCVAGGGEVVIPPSSTLPFVGTYYIVMAAIAGIILLMVLLTCFMRSCRRKGRSSPPPEQRAAPQRMETYVVSTPPTSAPIHQTSYIVQTPSAPAGAPPPVYPTVVAPPAYQPNPAPSQMYGGGVQPQQVPAGNYAIPAPAYYNATAVPLNAEPPMYDPPVASDPPVYRPNGGGSPPPQNPYA